MEASIYEIKGIGKKTGALYERLGILTVRDLLHYYPRGYESYPPVSAPETLAADTVAAIAVTVTRSPSGTNNSKYQMAFLDIPTLTGTVRLVWYHMPYIRSLIKRGMDYVFYGKVTEKRGVRCIEQPQIFSPEDYSAMTGRMLPVYSLTKGLTSKQIRKSVETGLREFGISNDHLPEDIKNRHELIDLRQAIRDIHFPSSDDCLTAARKRLVFDEFFMFLLMMRASKRETLQIENAFTFTSPTEIDPMLDKLSFPLTNAQKRAVYEVAGDMNGPCVMQRLIQGDVGSGKTIVAFLIMAYVHISGYQAAFMAPTDVLARQHYQKLISFCETQGIRPEVILLTGSLSAREKKDALEKIRENPDALVVGTHALFQEGVEFANLALVITDEQHRFGVRQRKSLSEKGANPHILAMSATPIPRTLAIILYGDLDISVIDELPAKRLPIKNCVVTPSWRENAYRFIEKEILAGHQAYVVCPLIEASEELDAQNVEDYAGELTEYYGGRYPVEILHGRMKPEEKNRIMERFLKNEISILVSTTVIEVGVDVPNATVMMIENAERFGLAQLHQLRGRIGRGSAQGYCIFMQGKESKQKNPRLEIINHSNDGFYIAQEDLKLRGPGEFLGVRQSGAFSFELGDVFADLSLLQEAAKEADRIEKTDPHLTAPDHTELRLELNRLKQRHSEDINL